MTPIDYLTQYPDNQHFFVNKVLDKKNGFQMNGRLINLDRPLRRNLT